ncbi:MAG: hypothetical protein R3F49_17525 [Planctomycetota bacterium]
MNSLAKKTLVIAGATLLAVSVSAQVRNRANMLRFQTVISNLGGGGGVITGPAPTSLSPVVVAVPVPLSPGGNGGSSAPNAGIDE